MRTAIALTTIIAASGLAVWWSVEHQRDHLVWDHFDVVKPGVLYRSGRLTPGQLEQAVSRYGLRTVVSFLRPGPEVEAERASAKRLGLDFLNLPMPGDGFGREDQFREALAAIDDPERRPVLVHCARGTCRTGAIVGLYRFERDGWTVEDVDREMERQVYRQGHLAGYVYEMVEDRPFAEIFEPRRSFDRNRPEPPAASTTRHDPEAPTHVR